MNTLRVMAHLSLLFILPAMSLGAERPTRFSGEKFFSEPEIRTFHFEVSESAIAQLRRAPRSYVLGTVRDGQHVLTNVAIRIKGMGSFRPIDETPSLAVKFDEFATNQ